MLKTLDGTVEVLYRRCSEIEAEEIMAANGVTDGRLCYRVNGHSVRSHPDTWITQNPLYARDYRPSGVNPDAYARLVAFYVQPGTIDWLEKNIGTKVKQEGPTHTFGITCDLREEFNGRIEELETYPIEEFSSRKFFKFLRADQDTYALFMAFSPEYLDGNSFSEKLRLDRMSWLKTSLLWMLWRSNWGHKKGQERILQFEVSSSYLDELFELAVYVDDIEGSPQVIRQDDPDRIIIEKTWLRGRQGYFHKSESTPHLGIRSSVLRDFAECFSTAGIEDITEIVQFIEEERPRNPEEILYDFLRLTPVYFVD